RPRASRRSTSASFAVRRTFSSTTLLLFLLFLRSKIGIPASRAPDGLRRTRGGTRQHVKELVPHRPRAAARRSRSGARCASAFLCDHAEAGPGTALRLNRPLLRWSGSRTRDRSVISRL